ncbi:hypothetical protein [Piscirickettsia salmonis]|uniref:hypothetical protein n=1 Tax=Piscirickettsia salmonis TaxID=1238 RepID=UPI0007C96344|nr:hypothetical protein A0O36_02817 [Piscirickettsiaceae bacterium NZ-RLO1]
MPSNRKTSGYTKCTNPTKSRQIYTAYNILQNHKFILGKNTIRHKNAIDNNDHFRGAVIELENKKILNKNQFNRLIHKEHGSKYQKTALKIALQDEIPTEQRTLLLDCAWNKLQKQENTIALSPKKSKVCQTMLSSSSFKNAILSEEIIKNLKKTFPKISIECDDPSFKTTTIKEASAQCTVSNDVISCDLNSEASLKLALKVGKELGCTQIKVDALPKDPEERKKAYEKIIKVGINLGIKMSEMKGKFKVDDPLVNFHTALEKKLLPRQKSKNLFDIYSDTTLVHKNIHKKEQSSSQQVKGM